MHLTILMLVWNKTNSNGQTQNMNLSIVMRSILTFDFLIGETIADVPSAMQILLFYKCERVWICSAPYGLYRKDELLTGYV